MRLKTDGNVAFMFLMLVATDGVGLLYEFVVIFQRGGSSCPSTGLTRTVSFGGFGKYSGNLLIVEWLPFFGGCEHLKGLSCSAFRIKTVSNLGLSLMSSLRS